MADDGSRISEHIRISCKSRGADCWDVWILAEKLHSRFAGIRKLREKARARSSLVRPISLLTLSLLDCLTQTFREIPYGHENSTP